MVTDADQLIEVTWRTIEDTVFSSGLWTLAEVAGYYNQRQNRFNRDAKLLLAHQPIAAVAGVASYGLPQDWIATQRATWTPKTAVVGGVTYGSTTPLTRSDRFAAQMGIAVGNAPLVPILLDDQSGGLGVCEIYPTPLTDGDIGLLYASILELLNFNPAVPDLFDVPDEFVPYVTYGVLADMLGKDGRGQDLARAAYCEMRYQEGVALATLLTGAV